MEQKIKISLILICILLSGLQATGQTPSELKYKIWDMHALRYYPFAVSADSIIDQMIINLPMENEKRVETKYTYVDAITNRELLHGQMLHSKMKNDMLNKLFFKPYRRWIEQMEPIKAEKSDLKLNLLSSGEGLSSAYNGIFDFPGNYTITQIVDDLLGDMSIFEAQNHVGLTTISGPLNMKSRAQYCYFLSAEPTVDGIPCYEIAFFSKEKEAYATEGLLFIDRNTHVPVKAVFTFNFALSEGYGKNLLMTHSFRDGKVVHKEHALFIGDDLLGSFILSQERHYDTYSDDLPTIRPMPEAPRVVATADSTRAWSNVKGAASLLFTEKIGIGKNSKVEVGPILQMFSYNKTEGFRFRLGLNTTTNLNPHLTVGGYMAYGTKDEKFKYRGDLHYSPKAKHNSLQEFPTSLISLTYVEDLNIPGQDLLVSQRDNAFRSFYHASINRMAWHKIARLAYRHEFRNRFSFELSGKYLSDESVGMVRYEPFSIAEAGLMLRYAPNEKTFQIRDRRMHLRSADLEIKLDHRMGVQGLFGSDYDYHITTLFVRKAFPLPADVGRMSISLSGGKVWSRLPFPLLFIPQGNQSYVFSHEGHNLMRFFEFATDQYVASSVNAQFNWSPVSFFLPRLGIRTDVGFKALYGPMSDKNNPDLHPSLPPLNNGVEALGNDPYLEASIGLSNIFRIFRVDYVHRLTYLNREGASRGSIFIGAGVSF